MLLDSYFEHKIFQILCQKTLAARRKRRQSAVLAVTTFADVLSANYCLSTKYQVNLYVLVKSLDAYPRHFSFSYVFNNFFVNETGLYNELWETAQKKCFQIEIDIRTRVVLFHLYEKTCLTDVFSDKISQFFHKIDIQIYLCKKNMQSDGNYCRKMTSQKHIFYYR